MYTQEEFNAYMRDYYKKNNQTKTSKVNNKIDEIMKFVLDSEENPQTKRDLIEMLFDLKTMVKKPKMEFKVPEEIEKFLFEPVRNPLMNVKIELK